eukprot:scaffold264_cov317-Pinguiococcus_pyrenoidosus.AAC.41
MRGNSSGLSTSTVGLVGASGVVDALLVCSNRLRRSRLLRPLGESSADLVRRGVSRKGLATLEG